jgi:hypothetical protein
VLVSYHRYDAAQLLDEEANAPSEPRAAISR